MFLSFRYKSGTTRKKLVFLCFLADSGVIRGGRGHSRRRRRCTPGELLQRRLERVGRADSLVEQ